MEKRRASLSSSNTNTKALAEVFLELFLAHGGNTCCLDCSGLGRGEEGQCLV